MKKATVDLFQRVEQGQERMLDIFARCEGEMWTVTRLGEEMGREHEEWKTLPEWVRQRFAGCEAILTRLMIKKLAWDEGEGCFCGPAGEDGRKHPYNKEIMKGAA